MAILPSITPARVPVKIDFDFFFDKAGVAANLSAVKRKGLNRAGFAVMQIARRSIKKMGMARPKLKVSKENPGRDLRSLASDLSLTGKRRDYVTAEKLLQKAWEIRFKPASRAGDPPHTHTGILRRSITFAYAPNTESVVVGGFMDGIQHIVSLHEHGGQQQMQAWTWISSNSRKYSGIIGWWAVGRQPHRRPNRWQQMGSQWVRSFQYPARPYMRPALIEGIRRGRIEKSFGTSVGFTGG